jgi:hypothetical protein
VSVRSAGEDRSLWYRSPGATWHTKPATHDFVAVALAHHAAAEGKDLVVEGPVMVPQLQRLDEFLQIWSVWRPDLFSHIEIRAEDEVPHTEQQESHGTPAGAVMGFSGGVDAAFALAAHHSGTVGRLQQRISSGVLVVGWDLRHGDEAGLRRAADAAEQSLEHYDVRPAVVATNWKDSVCPAWFMSYTCGLLSLLHLFSGDHAAAVLATDHNYRQELGMRPYAAHMIVNRLLGNPAFPVVSTGGTHRRIERVEFLKGHPALLSNLRVCYQQGAGGTNCGHCEKCVRTQLELRAVDADREVIKQAFPHPMTPEDLQNASVTNATVLEHFIDILDRLDGQDTDDGYATLVRRWVRRERLAEARRRNLPAARVAKLEQEAEELREQLRLMEDSRSWRMTAPLRAATEALREVGWKAPPRPK